MGKARQVVSMEGDDESRATKRSSSNQQMGKAIHFATLMDSRHLKNSELEQMFEKYKGHASDIVKDFSGSHAVFTERRIASIRNGDRKSFLDVLARQASDAVPSYTQVKTLRRC